MCSRGMVVGRWAALFAAHRRGRRACARLHRLPRRGAVRLPVRDALPLPDREGARSRGGAALGRRRDRRRRRRAARPQPARWSSPPIFGSRRSRSRWRASAARAGAPSWSTWDWVGLAVLLLGASVLVNAVLGQHDQAWFDATGEPQELDLPSTASTRSGRWSSGIGDLPARRDARRARAGTRPPSGRRSACSPSSSAAAGFCFVYYAGIKGAYLRETFVERDRRSGT